LAQYTGKLWQNAHPHSKVRRGKRRTREESKEKKQESSMIPVCIKETRGIKATIALALSTIEETSKKKRR
jgi:hypothetical protein